MNDTCTVVFKQTVRYVHAVLAQFDISGPYSIGIGFRIGWRHSNERRAAGARLYVSFQRGWGSETEKKRRKGENGTRKGEGKVA